MLHLLFHLYVTRSAPLWKLPPHAAFFSSTLAKFNLSDENARPSRTTLLSMLSDKRSTLVQSVYRHILVASQSSAPAQAQAYKRLFKYMPTDVQTQCASSLSYDPLPPPMTDSRSTGYDLRGPYWTGVESAFVAIGIANANAPMGGGGRRPAAAEIVAQIQVWAMRIAF